MWTIRAATERDLPGIFEIYDEEVLRGTATFETVPKTADERLHWLREHSTDRHPAIVAAEAGKVLGWASLSMWSTRCAYARAAENSVYVHPRHHGKGVGKALMQELIRRARLAGL